MSAPESVAARPVRQPFCFTASDRLPPRISFSPSATPLLSSSESTLSGLLTMACAPADNLGCQSAGGSISIYLCNSLKKSAPAWAMVVARPARSVRILGCPAGASTVIARCSARAVSMSSGDSTNTRIITQAVGVPAVTTLLSSLRGGFVGSQVTRT